MSQMCLNCGERPAVTDAANKTVPLCEVCVPKAGSSRGIKMSPKTEPKLQVIPGGKKDPADPHP